MAKSIPDRFPSNVDSIGIEVVGASSPAVKKGEDPPYEAFPAQDNQSLGWLIAELRQNFKVPLSEIFRHPVVSRKDHHEAETARW